jgi:phospholipid transport system substrate-binding protein
MLSRRFLLRAAGFAVLAAPLSAFAAGEPAVATVQSFYDTLLQAMKDGRKLGFTGRRDMLAPAIARAFDLPLMARLTVGAQWSGMSADEHDKLIKAFSAYSVATYANRFDDFSGEKFEVNPKPDSIANGDIIVHSRLVPNGDKPVQLDYLMHQEGGNWRIIDVYLNGTISELAARRSEFGSVLRRGGAQALIESLQQKTAELAS